LIKLILGPFPLALEEGIGEDDEFDDGAAGEKSSSPAASLSWQLQTETS